MPGNSFGEIFKIMTWGESHGKALGVVIDGVLPGIFLDELHIQKYLDKRRPGQSSLVSSRSEKDQVQILSGVYQNYTLGTPISLLVENKDVQSKDYHSFEGFFRPGHADYAYYQKYKFYDPRGGGRSSGRETLSRVAAASVALKVLEKLNSKIKIYAYTYSIGGIKIKKRDFSFIHKNPLKTVDKEAFYKMKQKINEAQDKKTTVGGVAEILIFNTPSGLGEPVFDKLDAKLAASLMSIGAVKGVEIGSGFRVAKMTGKQANDAFKKTSSSHFFETKTNHSGGILGGISTGMPIKIRIAIKPPSSIGQKQEFINSEGEVLEHQIKGRHDPCILPRIIPVIEAMTILVLCDSILLNRSLSVEN